MVPYGLFADDRAQVSGVGNTSKVAISLIVSVAIGGLVAAFLLPISINELVAVNTTGWSSGAQSMWNLLDVTIVLSVVLMFFGIALSATEAI